MQLAELRETVRALLAEGERPGLVALALERRRVLSVLVALTYENDSLLVARAISGFGEAAGAISDEDAEFVRGHLRRLLWLMSDESGGICLHGPELMAEVIVSRPERFAAFGALLESLLDTEPRDAERFRPSWERAMARLGEIRR